MQNWGAYSTEKLCQEIPSPDSWECGTKLLSVEIYDMNEYNSK